MAYTEEFYTIDWGHEYAGCDPRRAQAAAHRQKRRRRLKFLFWAVVDVALTAAITYLIMTYYGMRVRAVEAQPPQGPVASQVSPMPPAEEIAQEMPAPEDGAPGFEPVLQNPELPNGCEATSLAALLRWHGFAADKLELAYEYIPRADFEGGGNARRGPHPATAYAGDPATQSGYYCFAAPLAEGANQYLAGSGLACRDASGMEMEALDAQVAAGRPVVLWVTLDYGSEAEYMDTGWMLLDGSWYTPYRNLHCVMVYGAEGHSYQVADPLHGTVEVDKARLYQSYLALGGHAATIE